MQQSKVKCWVIIQNKKIVNQKLAWFELSDWHRLLLVLDFEIFCICFYLYYYQSILFASNFRWKSYYFNLFFSIWLQNFTKMELITKKKLSERNVFLDDMEIMDKTCFLHFMFMRIWPCLLKFFCQKRKYCLKSILVDGLFTMYKRKINPWVRPIRLVVARWDTVFSKTSRVLFLHSPKRILQK